MTKILFVCHGNICRSPMAEFIMKGLVKKVGLERQFRIASAATSTEEIGSPVYPPAQRKLAEHGISCAGKAARQLTQGDCSQYGLLIGMDRANLRNMRRICGGDFDGKTHLLPQIWGNRFIESLAKDIKLAFPNAKGYSIRNLKYMAKFAATCPDRQFVQTVSAQIPWSHNLAILNNVKDSDQRIWYIKKTAENGWSHSVLIHQIESRLYERQAIAEKVSNFEMWQGSSKKDFSVPSSPASGTHSP